MVNFEQKKNLEQKIWKEIKQVLHTLTFMTVFLFILIFWEYFCIIIFCCK